MSREEAIEFLKSANFNLRLKAARFFSINATHEDLGYLKAALMSETVSYVKTSLNQTIKKLEDAIPQYIEENVEEYDVPDEVRKQMESRLAEELSGLILHEIASPVGLLASAAEEEIADYDNSQTKRHVENLQKIFKALEQLKKASSTPKPIEFDLAALIHKIQLDLVDSEHYTAEVSFQGPEPFLIESDEGLLTFAIVNGLKNAFEAIEKIEIHAPHPIVVSWGRTDVDYWIAIADKGGGIVGPTDAAFGIGRTTKDGHIGFGLAVARQSIENLGGNCILQPVESGGAVYELRWPR